MFKKHVNVKQHFVIHVYQMFKYTSILLNSIVLSIQLLKVNFNC